MTEDGNTHDSAAEPSQFSGALLELVDLSALLGLLEGSPAQGGSDRNPADPEKIREFKSRLSGAAGLPMDVFDVRAIDSSRANSRARSESFGALLDRLGTADLSDWIFLGRLTGDESQYESITSFLRDRLSTFCTVAILFGRQPSWHVIRIFYRPDRIRVAKMIGQYLSINDDLLEAFPPTSTARLATFLDVTEKSVKRYVPIESNATLNNFTSSFCSSCDINLLHISADLVTRIASSLLAKQFLVLTGLSGSGKTKVAQALAAFLDCQIALDGSIPDGPGHVNETISRQRWSRDELLVVLELYHRKGTSPGAERDEVAELTGRTGASIDLRLANYLSEDPKREQQGLDAGGRAVTEIFHEYDEKAEALRSDASDARRRLERRKTQMPDSGSDSRGIVGYGTTSSTPGSALVPVGADWTGNESILGYPDGLDVGHYISTVALKLILDARHNPELPHFLILDEMNLSHVERYFADFLSAMESGQEIPLYEGSVRKAGDRDIPCRLKLPGNLFVIGTVNVDETTYMFSPKVLDRANVIEFRMAKDEMHSFLQSPCKPDLDGLQGKGAHFAKSFVQATVSEVEVPVAVRSLYAEEMKHLFALLGDHHAEFGYRTAHEAARFIHFYKELGGYADDDASWFPDAMDCMIAQKLLPKLHGSRTKLGPLLKDLWCATIDAPGTRSYDAIKDPKAEQLKDAHYPISADKVYRMWKLLGENGFASFAEA